MLAGSPVDAMRGELRIGGHRYVGSDYACLFVRPMSNASKMLVGAIATTGAGGQKAVERSPVFVSGASYPDCLAISASALTLGVRGAVCAGFFNSNWEIDDDNFAFSDVNSQSDLLGGGR
jgi:hypothetical protein